MGICLAVALCAAGFCQDTPDYRRPREVEEVPPTLEAVAIARFGVWAGRDFHFLANRTDGLTSTSKQEALYSASLMGGMEFYDHVLVLASFEGDVASKLSSDIGGLYLGWHQRPKERYGKGVPDDATVYAGVLDGSLTVHEANFGNFDRGIGVGTGINFGWDLTKHLSLDLYGEYRYLRFDYQKAVVSGDTSIGGNSGWFGLGLKLHF